MRLLLPIVLQRKVVTAVYDQVGHPCTHTQRVLLARNDIWYQGIPSELPEVHIIKANKKLHPMIDSLIAKRPLEVLTMDFTVLSHDTTLRMY